MRLTSFAVLLLLGFSTAACSSPPVAPPACGQPSEWRVPAAAPANAAEPVMAREVLERMARKQAVLLGEAHDSAEDHRWQLHTLTQLHALRPRMAIGFEMFPRRVQPALDQWVAGTLSEADFLKQAEWDKVWGFDSRDYLPLFHYARMNRIPMLALNVERSLVEDIGKQGWAGVPEARKEGVGTPAPPSDAYRDTLRAIFDMHPAKDRAKEDEKAAFARFVDSQTTWDRAMAQAMAAHLAKSPDALVVGILGAGHVRHGHGVAHQLKALGISEVGLLMTWDRDMPCAELEAGYADALYLVDPPKGNPPRLGVATEQTGTGLKITQVVAGSVAESAGLKSGDEIVTVAGQPARNLLTLRGAVQRQPPGTWLPLKIRRDGTELDIVARFPLGS